LPVGVASTVKTEKYFNFLTSLVAYKQKSLRIALLSFLSLCDFLYVFYLPGSLVFLEVEVLPALRDVFFLLLHHWREWFWVHLSLTLFI